MSNTVIFAIVVAIICALISAGGLKDWKDAHTWERVRIVIPAIIALIISAYVVTKFSGFETASKPNVNSASASRR